MGFLTKFAFAQSKFWRRPKLKLTGIRLKELTGCTVLECIVVWEGKVVAKDGCDGFVIKYTLNYVNWYFRLKLWC